MSQQRFTAGQAAKIAGVSYHILHYWATQGYVVPSIAEVSGSGSCSVYSFADVVALRVAYKMRLQCAGMAVISRTAKFVASLDFSNPGKSYLQKYLIVPADGLPSTCCEHSLEEWARANSMFWLMGLEDIAAEVAAAATQAKQPSRGKAAKALTTEEP